jgi:outer membrane protein assembly factor BamB
VNALLPLKRPAAYLLALVAAVFAAAAWLDAAETGGEKKDTAAWPRFRGPGGDGISSEKNWSADWPENGPKEAWTRGIGTGYSTVSVADGRVYTMGNEKSTDYVWCLSEKDGSVIWKQSYPCKNCQYPGPRATPTVADGSVYILSARGDVACFDAAKGTPRWSKRLAKELGAKAPKWGFSGSPLVDGGLVIYNVGSAGTALNRKTGEIVWESGNDVSGYSTPVVFEMGQKRCVLLFIKDALVCLDITDGQRLWSIPWRTSYDVNAADPVMVGDDRIFITSGYRVGCALIEVKGGRPRVVWQNKNMASQFSTPVAYKGHLYGADGNTGRAVLKCVEIDTGKVKWSTDRLKMAALMVADGKLIVQADGGHLAVGEATPQAWRPTAKAQPLKGMCWTMPVLANGRIYCRNNRRGQLVCLDVSK